MTRAPNFSNPSNIRLGGVTLFALVLLLAWDATGGDLALARLAGTPMGFPWRDNAFLVRVMHEAAKNLSWLCAIALFAELNAGDETPGAVSYGTWWSPCDEIINPDSSVALSGATNTKTACISHTALMSDATVYGQVREFVK